MEDDNLLERDQNGALDHMLRHSEGCSDLFRDTHPIKYINLTISSQCAGG